MDFQCTALLSDSHITRYYAVLTKTKELVASLATSSPMVQVLFFFKDKTMGNYILSKVMQINISKRMFSVSYWERTIKA